VPRTCRHNSTVSHGMAERITMKKVYTSLAVVAKAFEAAFSLTASFFEMAADKCRDWADFCDELADNN